jgi:hypothetical protein
MSQRILSFNKTRLASFLSLLILFSKSLSAAPFKTSSGTFSPHLPWQEVHIIKYEHPSQQYFYFFLFFLRQQVKHAPNQDSLLEKT